MLRPLTLAIASLGVFAACSDAPVATPPPADVAPVDAPSDKGSPDDVSDVAQPDAAPDAQDDAPIDASIDATMDAAPDLPLDTAPPPCRVDADCASSADGRACDATAGRCVPCTAASDLCPAGQYCVAAMNRCADGCRDDGSCASAPDGGAAAQRCDPASRRCVACLASDDCPLGTLCMDNACAPGCTPSHGCPAAQSCCTGACADVTASAANCGACGAACAVANGTPACLAGACAVATCTMPFGDCDATAADGCETDLSTSAANCGRCGAACEARPGTTATCAAGACVFACAAGRGDCDGDLTNGCEVDLAASADNCGRCGGACAARPGATASCASGACSYTCASGLGDCDGDGANGCETDVRTSAAHCGRCGVACAAPDVCGAGACNAPASCAALHAAAPALPSGRYTIDPDGPSGAVAPFAVYCDMASAGGGWTMVLMAGTSPAGTFGYDAAAWTNEAVVNADETDPARNADVKSRAFSTLAFREARFCLGTIGACLTEAYVATSARELFGRAEAASTRPIADYGVWGYGGVLGCNRRGLNVFDVGGGTTAAARAHCRYGILLNNESACEGSVDGGRGLGCRGYFGTQISAGQGDGIVPTGHERGWIFVR